MWRDLLAAIRGLARARGLTAAAVATLALGVGATTLVWGVVDGLVLRPLPFGERTPRLVSLHSTHPTQAAGLGRLGRLARRSPRPARGVPEPRGRRGSAAPQLLARRRRGVRARARRLGDARALPDARGRAASSAAASAPTRAPSRGHEGAALISHALWSRRFAADPAIVGRAVLLNGRAVTVVGVMPEGFRFPEQHDVWLPYAPPRDAQRDARSLLAIGLLREGTSVAAAREELAAAAARLAARHPQTNRGWGVHLLPLHDYYVGDHARRALTTMLAAVLLVLLVACANVSGLLLARGIGRHQELTRARGDGRLPLAAGAADADREPPAGPRRRAASACCWRARRSARWWRPTPTRRRTGCSSWWTGAPSPSSRSSRSSPPPRAVSRPRCASRAWT